MSPRDDGDALACYREMARNTVGGLARAPWDERDDADALDAADAREAQRAIDDGEVTQRLPWERAWTAADAVTGGAS